MKIKLDENIPLSLVISLKPLGHEIDTVQEEGLKGKVDNVVWKESQKAGRFLITQDLDFSDIRQFTPGDHAGILLLRLRDPGRLALAERIQNIFQTEDVEKWKCCFVVATERKIRIRRPAE